MSQSDDQGADVVPADVERQHRGGGRLFHHGVVDGDVGSERKSGLVETQEAKILVGAFEGGARGLHYVRRQPLDLIEVGLGVQHEDAAIPEMSGRDIDFGRCTAGFSAKAATAKALPSKPGSSEPCLM